MNVRIRVSVGDAAIEDFKADELGWEVAEQIEAATGLGYKRWAALLDSDEPGQTRARRGLAWLVLRQRDPNLRIEEVPGSPDDLKVENLVYCPECKDETDTALRRYRDGRPPQTICLVCGHVYPDDKPPSEADRPPKAVPSKGSRTAAGATRPSSPTSSE